MLRHHLSTAAPTIHILNDGDPDSMIEIMEETDPMMYDTNEKWNVKSIAKWSKFKFKTHEVLTRSERFFACPSWKLMEQYDTSDQMSFWLISKEPNESFTILDNGGDNKCLRFSCLRLIRLVLHDNPKLEKKSQYTVSLPTNDLYAYAFSDNVTRVMTYAENHAEVTNTHAALLKLIQGVEKEYAMQTKYEIQAAAETRSVVWGEGMDMDSGCIVFAYLVPI